MQNKPRFSFFPQKQDTIQNTTFLEDKKENQTLDSTSMSIAFPRVSQKKRIYHRDRYQQIEFFMNFPQPVTQHLKLDKSKDLSGSIGDNGITWLLSGKNLFIWQFASVNDSSKILWCHSLEVPLSGGGCKIAFIEREGREDEFEGFEIERLDNLGVIAITSEGSIRYWNDIGREKHYEEYTIDLSPNETLHHISNSKKGVVFVASNHNIYRIVCSRRCSISHLQKDSSLFSWFSWGQKKTPKIKSLHITKDECLYVLSEENIEKWSNITETPKFECEWDIHKEMSEKLDDMIKTVQSDIERNVRLVTIQSKGSKLYLLTGFYEENTNSNEVPLVNYCISELNVENKEHIDHVIDIQLDYEQEREDYLFNKVNLHFGKFIYILFEDTLITLSYKFELLPRITLDEVVGGGVVDDKLHIMSYKNGILRSSNPSMEDTVPSEEDDEMYDVVMPSFQIEEEREYKSEIEIQSEKLLKIFQGKQKKQDLRAISSEAIIKACKQIVNARSSAAVIWSKDPVLHEPLKASLLILKHLERKQASYDKFLKFLRENGCWTRLNDEEKQIILEFGGKLAVAIGIRKLKNPKERKIEDEASTFLTHAIIQCCEQRNLQEEYRNQETFYSHITKIDEIFKVAIDYETKLLNTMKQKDQGPYIVWKVNSLFEALIDGIHEFRKSHQDYYPKFINLIHEWASAKPIRVAIGKQLSISEQILPETNQTDQLLILEQMFHLADYRLDCYIRELGESPNNISLLEEYQSARSNSINIFIERGAIHVAYTLAEKYNDFNILIELCEANKHYDRLKRYMEVYGSKFVHTLFQYYYDNGKYKQLLNIDPKYYKELERFVNALQTTPDLKWMHAVQSGNLTGAANILNILANQSNHINIKKKKLSMAKLCCLANPTTEEMLNATKLEEIDLQLRIITAQEQLKNDFKYPNLEKPLSPEDIIRLCCSKRSFKVTDDDDYYKISLALETYIHYVKLQKLKGRFDETENLHLLVYIWISAFNQSENLFNLAEKWEPNDDESREAVHQSVIFRCAKEKEHTDAALTEFVQKQIHEYLKKYYGEDSNLLKVLATVCDELQGSNMEIE